MADNQVTIQTGGATLVARIFGLYWLFNMVYTCVFWGGGAICFNLFVPYAFIYDLIVKYVGPWMGK